MEDEIMKCAFCGEKWPAHYGAWCTPVKIEEWCCDDCIHEYGLERVREVEDATLD